MNISVLAVFEFVAGFVMVYSGVNDIDPRDAVKAALKGQNPRDLTRGSTGSTDSGASTSPSAPGERDDGVEPIPNAPRNPRDDGGAVNV